LPRSYLVSATQRSGSTLLCELLKGTGVAGRPEEFFEAVHDTGLPPHPGVYLIGLPRTGAGIRDDDTPPEAPAYSSLEGIADYREHLERTFTWGTTDNGVFASKLMWNQVPEIQALTSAIPEYRGLRPFELLSRLFDDPAYVWVIRRDKVRQAVSLWKALQTRSWRDGGGRRPAELHYRYEGINHLIELFESDDQAWGAFFAEHGIAPLVVGYEDHLELDQDAAVRSVLTLIGVAPPAGWEAVQPMERQADALSEEWVAAYHRDRAQLGQPSATAAGAMR
jgi:trehalose 2-sulfotransferase